jgi:hypothetical protein
LSRLVTAYETVEWLNDYAGSTDASAITLFFQGNGQMQHAKPRLPSPGIAFKSLVEDTCRVNLIFDKHQEEKES